MAEVSRSDLGMTSDQINFLLTLSFVRCSNNVIVGVPETVATVKVAQPARPTMRLEGPDIVTHSETEVSLGVAVLQDLSISSNVDKTEKLESYKVLIM